MAYNKAKQAVEELSSSTTKLQFFIINSSVD